MRTEDDRLFPVLLIVAQAVVWPGAALARGTVPEGPALLVAALVAGVVTAALVLRRSRPVVALVVVAAACALGAGPLPVGATALLGTAGVALALYTVATERDTFTAVLCVVALAAWQGLMQISLHGLGDPSGLDLVLTALLYATACGAGLLVRRARRARWAAEQRLQRAESERHRLPTVERRRMERELHDVSAHHLTAVVVTAGAALGLRDQRPELAGQALEFAVETGREVTRALGAVRAPAPSREDLPSPVERLSDLVAGFRRLDQRIDCELEPLPDGAVADAAYGIVREGLTNVARHAPGAHTRVRVRYGETRTDVVVTSAAPPAGTTVHAAGLGGGRGQGFLRSRAREAGGTLTSGPTGEGGWEIRAALPGRTAAPVEAALPRGYRVAQLVAAAGLVLQPLLPALVIRPDTATATQQASAGSLFALLAAAQALTLLWLPRAPRTALTTLLALPLLWPLAMTATHYTGPPLLPPALSLLTTCAAITLQTARGIANAPGTTTDATDGAWEPTTATAPSQPSKAGDMGHGPADAPRGPGDAPRGPVDATGPVSASASAVGRADARGPVPPRPHRTLGVFHAPRSRRPHRSLPLRLLLPTSTRPLAFPLAAVVVHSLAAVVALVGQGNGGFGWGVGVCGGVVVVVGGAVWGGVVRGRRVRGDRGARDERVALWTEEAVRDAWAERRRIAAGLETTVLSRTADMVEEAEAGRLDAVADRAREALAAMRALLDTVRDGERDAGPGRSPQPTLQALDLLAHQSRATGRDVRIRLTDQVPERLPTAVDLAAYHAAETILAAGGDQPTMLEFDAHDGTLTLTATGVPHAGRTAVLERLTARVAPLGGTLTIGGPDTVHLRLPLAAAPVPQQGDATEDEEGSDG
ncbi:histidine kinase [Streptomyces sp. 11x1]|uniref:sensor histidine kinase n=1 Tax=Streptomyces sp. 11x1 TaxID=3038642 RepID=UPI0029313C3D|nr:histidine kinase [Streptomyces sp. 11x1]WNZ14526.1 histidine kinase [Streptomyces sp. 11x1]